MRSCIYIICTLILAFFVMPAHAYYYNFNEQWESGCTQNQATTIVGAIANYRGIPESEIRSVSVDWGLSDTSPQCDLGMVSYQYLSGSLWKSVSGYYIERDLEAPTPEERCLAKQGESVRLQWNSAATGSVDSGFTYNGCLYSLPTIDGVSIPYVCVEKNESNPGLLCSGEMVATGDVAPGSSPVEKSPDDGCAESEVNLGGYCYPVSGSECPPGFVEGSVNGDRVCGRASNASVPGQATPESPLGSAESGGETPFDKTPGANSGTCNEQYPDCGQSSGSDSGKCDPLVNEHCIADVVVSGANTGVCSAGDLSCGAASGSQPGRCDPAVDANCRPSGIGSGTCRADFIALPQCSGDPVQCAIAR